MPTESHDADGSMRAPNRQNRIEIDPIRGTGNVVPVPRKIGIGWLILTAIGVTVTIENSEGKGLMKADEHIRVELVDWAHEELLIRTIRETVFIDEQAVPVELEWDGLDSQCAHVLAWNDRNEAIGTARMQPNGTIGRMAVLKDWRGRGAGRAMLQTLLDLAVKQEHAQVTLSAQTHAIGFYERAGFHTVGEPFIDAGIPHRKMMKELLKQGPE